MSTLFDHLGPVGRFIRASVKYAESGFKNVDTATYHKRLLICGQCDRNKNGICSECGCLLSAKAMMSTERCPLGKWSNDTLPSTEFIQQECGGCSDRV